MAYTTIDDPSAYFQAKAYSGTASGSTDTTVVTFDGNSDLQPDLLLTKRRDAAGDPSYRDSSRGVTKVLYSGTYGTDAEATSGTSPRLQSFDTDGFTFLGYGPYDNISGATYVGMGWKANGGTTSSNTDGSITSTVQANTDAGFSIGTFTGTGSTATVGHGLGVKPDMLILKSRNNPSGAAMYWMVAHVGLDDMAGTKNLFLNESWAEDTNATVWGNTAPTSSVFTVGTHAAVNYSGNDMLFYAFTSVQGYSKFGSYEGMLGSTRPVYTGFKPALVIIKKTSAENWVMVDADREPSNAMYKRLFPNLGNAENTGINPLIDFYSNGFRIVTNSTTVNSPGTGYIYMAFAENPFVTSTGIPTTAR